MWIIHGWCLQLQSWKQLETWEGPGLKWGSCITGMRHINGHCARHTFLRGQKSRATSTTPSQVPQSSLHPHRRAVSTKELVGTLIWTNLLCHLQSLLPPLPHCFMPYCPASWKNLASVGGTCKRFQKVNNLGLFEAFCRANCKQFLPFWWCFPRPKINIWGCWFICAVGLEIWDWKNAKGLGTNPTGWVAFGVSCKPVHFPWNIHITQNEEQNLQSTSFGHSIEHCMLKGSHKQL